MKIPSITGVIERRILVNFRIDPDVMDQALPAPFRSVTVNGHAIGGICLIRLGKVRPRMLPLPWGISSENAAHRIAVHWDDDGEMREGVYIPRRDTNSRLNTWAGGRVFPGVHHHATFDVEEAEPDYAVRMRSEDGGAEVFVKGSIADDLPASSTFDSLAAASQFFENGSLGYSATGDSDRFNGLELRCAEWSVDPLDVDEVKSSYFEDRSRFPEGSVEFDCALLMRDIPHEWHARSDLCCP
ncbi:MAG: DUF2071 domain-containing protein [Phycisphaeraceae bacterium]|nr:DUF2071 domain-containing protein [Phycisphaeraceae bacterium]